MARYYRPNDKNIHRKPDATDEDEWGVTPDEGYLVPVDEETLKVLMRRWQEASYPMLSSSRSDEVGNQKDVAESDDGTKETADPEVDASSKPVQDDVAPSQTDVDGGLSVDPQLQRAVDAIRAPQVATRAVAA